MKVFIKNNRFLFFNYNFFTLNFIFIIILVFVSIFIPKILIDKYMNQFFLKIKKLTLNSIFLESKIGLK